MAQKQKKSWSDVVHQVKQTFSNLSENLTGFGSEDSKVTWETVRIWCSHALSFITGCGCGWGTYVFCAEKQQAYNAAVEAYQTGLRVDLPVSLLFIITMIICWAVSLILSAVIIAMFQIIGGGLLTANLKNRAEVRTLGVSISLLCYVIVVAAGVVF
jgi:hypothetical protein